MSDDPQPVHLVLFDLDGTVLDHDGAAAAAVEQWLTAAGWADPAEARGLVTYWHEIAERHFPAYRRQELTFQGQRRARLRDFLPRLGLDASTWSSERLDSVFDGYLAAYEAAWRPYADAGPCLETLRQVLRVAALSNGDRAQQRAKLSRTGLDRYLGAVLTSSQMGVAKPDPRIFVRACRRLGASPEATVYVGDRLEVDAVAASTAGLRGVWLNRTGQPAPSGVETIDTLAQLPALVSLSAPRP